MENFPNFILFTSIFLGIIIYVHFFSKKARIKRKLKKAFSKKISEFRNGEIAKIIGNIEVIEELLTAPFSNRPCVYYHAHVQEDNDGWTTLVENEVSSNFLIRDGDHYAYINAHTIKSYLIQDAEYKSGFGNDATPNLEGYLKNHGQTSETFIGLNKKLRYLEGILENNEQVAVFGEGQWKEATQLGLPEKYGQVLEISSEDTVYLSDDPKTTLHKVKKQSEHVKNYSYTKDYK